MLEKGEWRCGAEFLQIYIPEYRSRINELRKKYTIVAQRCRNPQHVHKGGMQEWRLLGEAGKVIFRDNPLPSTVAFLNRFAKPKELTKQGEFNL